MKSRRLPVAFHLTAMLGSLGRLTSLAARFLYTYSLPTDLTK